MAAESRIARIGATLFAPRRIARRDLEAHDGKAGDDLMLLAVLALLLDGATNVARAVRALSVGRTNTALHALADVMRPAAPLFAAWLVTTVILLVFTHREPKRAAGELGARVTSALVLVSLLVAPFVGMLDPGPFRYTLEMLPWAACAIVFGLVLREALDDGAHVKAIDHQLFAAGATLLVSIAASGVFLVGRAVSTVSAEQAPQGVGAMAAPIDLPLLGGGRFKLEAQRGRPVVVTFWATWCPPCMQELPVLQRVYAGRGANDALLYAINVDESGAGREQLVAATAKRLGLTMPIALDDGAASQAWSVATIPTLARVGADGRVVQLDDHPLDEAGLRDVLH